jgi:hypothetical protein
VCVHFTEKKLVGAEQRGRAKQELASWSVLFLPFFCRSFLASERESERGGSQSDFVVVVREKKASLFFFFGFVLRSFQS